SCCSTSSASWRRWQSRSPLFARRRRSPSGSTTSSGSSRAMARSLLGCSLLALLIAAPGTKAQQGESALRPFVYREVEDRELRAFVALPDEPGPRRPAILLFHGVGWTVGEAAWTFDRAREFAAQGLVAMSIEYRLAEDGLSPADSIEDACAAFAW